MAPNAPPSFSCASYWDERFQKQTTAFDWLLPASCFDKELEDFQAQDATSSQQVFHIGSGTSMLSFHLKELLGSGYQIHNVDFSHEAVAWGKSKEVELDSRSEGSLPMQWSQVSLLSLPSVLAVATAQSIGLIVDKSTSDAIACGLDVRIRIPQSKDPVSQEQIHPLYILALNLAIVAAAGARWLTLSYSSDRYPFLPALFGTNPDVRPEGVPDPALYWKLLRKNEIQTEQEVPEKYKQEFGFVHRPVTSHYLYVLERTSVVLDASDVERLDVQAEER